MPTVFFPDPLRRFTDGLDRARVDGRSIREVFRALEVRFPGLAGRLEEGIAVAIDGEIVNDPLLEPVRADSEIHFLPPVSGG